MAESPNLVLSDEYKFNNSIDLHSIDEHKPKLVQDTTTDVKLNLLANPVKITFYDNSEENDHKSVSSEFTSDEKQHQDDDSHHSSSPSSRRSPVSSHKEPKVSFQMPPIRNENEERYRKIELLRIFQELEEKGIKMSTRYSMSSKLDDMEQEYEILRSIQNKKNGVKLYKSFMLNAIGAMEFLNESYNPFDFHLKGFSEHVSLGVDDYDEVFGEIYEKYKDSGKRMEPEFKLCLMLMASASSYHCSQSMLKDTPSLRDMVKKNPHFVNNIAKKMTTEPKIATPPEFIPNDTIKGPNAAEFLNRMRERSNQEQTIPEPISTRNNRVESDSISEVTSTTKRKAGLKKKGLNINLG